MAGWGLTRTVRGEYGKYAYTAVLGRFRINWERRQGARDVWVVFDTKAHKSFRADNLSEVRETVAEVMRDELRKEFPSP